MGYDELVRYWESASQVDQMKGLILFSTSVVEEVNTQLTARDLARYGIQADSSWTPSLDNSVMIRIRGVSKSITISFSSAEERTSFVSLIS